MAERRRVTLERIYSASPEDVWDLWTTKEGIESWWGPDGFSVEVHAIDLRPGGILDYSMTARRAQEIEYLKSTGFPLTTRSKVTYTEVVPHRRLGYDHVVDFVSGVKPYDVAHLVELTKVPQGVKLVLTFDAMHAEEWTNRAVAGWTSELTKLEKALQG